MRGGGVVVGVVLVSHLDLGHSLKRAAEMLLGPQPGVLAVGLAADADAQVLRDELGRTLQQVAGPAGVLVLADLYGGSPEAEAVQAAGELLCPVEVVAGVNLPLLLAALTMRERLPLGQLAAQVRKAGREGLVRVPVSGRWPPALPGSR